MRRALRLTLLCLVASALSYGYLLHYLRGGPRIIDATSYWLQARALWAGGFSFEVPAPLASFSGRFLLGTSEGDALGVIFPPGYPLVLAAGMALGTPLLVGPVLGGALVAATFSLARSLGQSAAVAWTAASLSVLSAALRYHTADTMSHGLAALLACLAVASALGRGRTLGPWLSGLCLGLLLATRPVSGAVSALLVAWVLRRAGARPWLLTLCGAAPGVLLLLLQQRALTGSWLASAQLTYYGLSDAPADCFRYGFGQGIGCRFEHGAFVERFLAEGYGVGPALRNLGARLALFVTDATNTAPLTLLALYAAIKQRRGPLALAGAAIVLQSLAYVPFYFDGNYPGGGARFLCEAIPFCQILVARAAVDLGLQRWAAPLALAGFAVYGRHGHELLREREGGRPLFEPAVLREAGVRRGLVLVDTDHGFNLGHAPSQRDAHGEVVVARWRGDRHDRELFESLGRPATYRYRYDMNGIQPPRVEPFVPKRSDRYEGEAFWPGDLSRGNAYPIHHPCASSGRALRLLAGTRIRIPLTSEGAMPEALTVGWVNTGGASSKLVVRWAGGSRHISAAQPGCHVFPLFPGGIGPEAPPSRSAALKSLEVELTTGEGALDYLAREP